MSRVTGQKEKKIEKKIMVDPVGGGSVFNGLPSLVFREWKPESWYMHSYWENNDKGFKCY